jgi:SAM-dependent methyltransferase
VFTVPAEAYDRFMGRYATPLAPRFAEFAGVRAGQRVLDVGCGPGALTCELIMRLGASSVWAVDPSAPFVDAARQRHPRADVRRAAAEELPFADDDFDASLAQLVVHFMAQPVRGLTELGRVTRPLGVVAACVWDHGGGRGPLSAFWDAARKLDPGVRDESDLHGSRQGQLTQLFAEAGLIDVEETELGVTVDHESFQAWWEPFTFGVGPAGTYLSRLDADSRTRLRDLCRTAYPNGSGIRTAYAWAARGRPCDTSGYG